MSMNRKKTNASRDSNRENVLNELLNELDRESFIPEEPDVVRIYNGNAVSAARDRDNTPQESVPAAPRASGSQKPKKRFYFVFAVFMIIMTVIGITATVMFAVDKIKDATSSSSLKDEYTRFLLPVVANDIAPFENENELSNTAKINCAIWNIMLNHDTSSYRLSEVGEFLIPEYDVEYSCKELFGTSSGLIHRSVGSTDMSFSYDSDNHVYSCMKDLRYLTYVPVITEISQSGGIYTLTVDYYSPSVRFLSENMGIEAETEKTMKYIINRYDGKNTLVAVQFTSDIISD